MEIRENVPENGSWDGDSDTAEICEGENENGVCEKRKV